MDAGSGAGMPVAGTARGSSKAVRVPDPKVRFRQFENAGIIPGRELINRYNGAVESGEFGIDQ